MALIKGMTVVLLDRTETDTDPFGAPIYVETAIPVDNVLVAPASSDDIIDNTDLEGRKAVYTLAIPKGDTHNWTNQKVQFFGKTFKAFGEPLTGIEANIPLEWNTKITVELCEDQADESE